MLNIVEKYSADTVVESDEGVVAIEYVLLAAIVAIAVAALAGPLNGLAGRLTTIISGVAG